MALGLGQKEKADHLDLPFLLPDDDAVPGRDSRRSYSGTIRTSR
jgi:hypothetical protein